MFQVLTQAGERFIIFPALQSNSPPEGVPSGGVGGLLSYKRLIAMCRWMGSHFHDWIDNNGVAFSRELLEWGRTFSDLWGKTVLLIYG